MRSYKLVSCPCGPLYRPRMDNVLHQRMSCISREMVAGVFDSQLRGRKDLTVCFTGHRVVPLQDVNQLSARVDALLEHLYQRGYRDFISGAALGFDLLCAERVIALKCRHADAMLHLAIPCSNQADRWPAHECMRYEQILYNADCTHVLSREYYAGCMHVRNRFMVDRSAFCLCFLTNHRGGTMSTVAYAMEQGCPVLNVAMEDACESFMREE